MIYTYIYTYIYPYIYIYLPRTPQGPTAPRFGASSGDLTRCSRAFFL